jgi:hypothetical protein
MDRESITLLSAILVLAVGSYGLLKGRLMFGHQDSEPSDDRGLSGTQARLVSFALALSGVAMFFNLTLGIFLILVAITLAWLLGR